LISIGLAEASPSFYFGNIFIMSYYYIDMNIPLDIDSIINRINRNEDDWKAIYTGVWGFRLELLKRFENTSEWNRPYRWGLPAFPKGYHEYTPNQLCSILASKDIEITFEHLIVLFLLFEDLLKKSSEIFCSKRLETFTRKGLKEFFQEEYTKEILSDEQLTELILAKETRNCYIHNGGKIDKHWIDAYENARGKTNGNIGDDLTQGIENIYSQVENWHKLILEITHKIKIKVESK
jgi:hypothetical protein